MEKRVLNLVINGLPSILKDLEELKSLTWAGFKPCYKWITFNTDLSELKELISKGFKPCYKWITFNTEEDKVEEVIEEKF